MPVFKRYLDEMPGVPLQDIWTDIAAHQPIEPRKARLSHAKAGRPDGAHHSSRAAIEGDVVLDPFCGCGTTSTRLNSSTAGGSASISPSLPLT